jgi:hypothetical protein
MASRISLTDQPAVIDQPAMADQPAPPSGPESARRNWTRPVLWLLLVLGATGSVVSSAAGMIAVNVVCGVLTLGFAAALVRHHYRARRR